MDDRQLQTSCGPGVPYSLQLWVVTPVGVSGSEKLSLVPSVLKDEFLAVELSPIQVK